MLSRKHAIIALGLLLALTGLFGVSVQAQKKPPKEIVTSTRTGLDPVVKISEHASVVTPCADSPAEAQIPLTATVQNYSTSDLRYTWTVDGVRLNNETANVVWDLTNLTPGTHTLRVEVEKRNPPLNENCYAFATTRVNIKPCPPPPVVCPNVSIYCPETVTLGAPVTFTANLNGGTPNITPIYNWTVTAGVIISGQGTPTIQVDTTGLGGQSITANLSVQGYNLNCPASCSVQVPRKISSNLSDSYPPIQMDDEKARLDNFAIQLQNDPNAKGYVVVYSGARMKPGEKQKRIKRAYNYLVNTRGLSADRLVTMEGGTRDVTTTELWIVPLGAEPPIVR